MCSIYFLKLCVTEVGTWSAVDQIGDYQHFYIGSSEHVLSRRSSNSKYYLPACLLQLIIQSLQNQEKIPSVFGR